MFWILLWVQLVERAIYAHGNVQVVQSSVLTNLVHYSSHSSSADLSSTAGHSATHLLDDNTVITGAVKSQLLQDRPDLQQCQTITVEQEELSESESEVSQQQDSRWIPLTCSQSIR